MFFIKPVIIFVLNWEMQAQSTVTHTRANSLGAAKRYNSIITDNVHFNGLYAFLIQKYSLYNSRLLFVMSIVSTFTDLPYRPLTSQVPYQLFISSCKVCSETSSKAPSTVLQFLGTLLFAAICYSPTRTWDSAGNEMWLWYFMRLSLPFTRALVPV